jgi:hypothetical protein
MFMRSSVEGRVVLGRLNDNVNEIFHLNLSAHNWQQLFSMVHNWPVTLHLATPQQEVYRASLKL